MLCFGELLILLHACCSFSDLVCFIALQLNESLLKSLEAVVTLSLFEAFLVGRFSALLGL